MANKTFAELQRQLITIQRDMEKARSKEKRGVIKRITAAIAAYGISARELGFTATDVRPGAEVAPNGARATRRTLPTPGKVYVSSTGVVWNGQGKKPAWLLKQMRVGGHPMSYFERDPSDPKPPPFRPERARGAGARKAANKLKPARKTAAKKKANGAASKSPSHYTYVPFDKREAIVEGATYRSPRGLEWRGGDVPIPKWALNHWQRSGTLAPYLLKS